VSSCSPVVFEPIPVEDSARHTSRFPVAAWTTPRPQKTSQRALCDPGADRALLAEVLTLPSETYLSDRMMVVDVDGLHRAHRRLTRHIGERLRADLLAVYHDNAETGDYVFSPEVVGRRALKNLALAYLVRAGDGEGLALCHVQFAAAHNMTDVMAALRLLAEQGGAEADAALAVSIGAGRVNRWCSTSGFGPGLGPAPGCDRVGRLHPRLVSSYLKATACHTTRSSPTPTTAHTGAGRSGCSAHGAGCHRCGPLPSLRLPHATQSAGVRPGQASDRAIEGRAVVPADLGR
jgi:hypothetical protein